MAVAIKYSNTPGNIPTLVEGEIAINQADRLLFTRDGTGNVISTKLDLEALIETKAEGLLTTTDWNTALKSGFYSAAASAANNPGLTVGVSTTALTGIVAVRGAPVAHAVQIVFQSTADLPAYIRVYTGTWSAWTPIQEFMIKDLIKPSYLAHGNIGVNLVPNPSFEVGTDGWLFKNGATLATSSENSYGGAFHAVLARSSSEQLESTNFIPIAPSKPLALTALVRGATASAAGGWLRIMYYKADKTAASTTFANPYSNGAVTTSWTEVGGIVTPPADARFAKIRVIHTTTSSSPTLDVDNVRLSVALDGSDLAPNLNLPGAPTTTTAAAGDSSTKVATTAFVNNTVTSATALKTMSTMSYDSVDMNTLDKVGEYRFINNAGSNNAPLTSSYSFYHGFGGGNNADRGAQTLLTSSGRFMSRVKTSNTWPTWTEWANTTHTHSNASQTTAGFMAASDKLLVDRALAGSAIVPSGVGLPAGDFNAITEGGYYTIASGWANGPLGAASTTYTGTMLVLVRSFAGNARPTQLYFHQDWMAFRSSTGGGVDTVWGPWKTLSFTDSPALTGTPTAPTAAANTNNTQIATTGHVHAYGTAFGLGKTSPSKGVFDLNNADLGSFISVNGNYSVSAANNWPTGITGLTGTSPVWWNVQTIGSSTRITQIAHFGFSNSGAATYSSFQRYKHDSTWSPWVEIINAPALLRRRNEVLINDVPGFVGDGVTDDVPALNLAFADLTKGGIVRSRPGTKILIDSSFTLNRGQRLVGDFLPYQPYGQSPSPDASASTLIVNSSTSIKVGMGAELAGHLIWRKGLTPIPNPGWTEAMIQAAYDSFAGLAVDIVDEDAYVHDNMMIGFNKGIQIIGKPLGPPGDRPIQRPKVFRNHMDCVNGIEATEIRDAGEMPGISENRCYKYLISNMPVPWKYTRHYGTAYYFHDGCDGLIARGNFAYGYNIGLHLKNVGLARFGGCFDNCHGGDPVAVTGAIGVLTQGDINSVTLSEIHVDSHDFNFVFDHSSGGLVVEGLTTGNCKTNQIIFGTGSRGVITGAIGGVCDTPFSVREGVGNWGGYIDFNSYPSSGNMFFVFGDFDTAARKLVDLKVKSNTGQNLNGRIPNIAFHTYANRPTWPLPGERIMITDANVATYGAIINSGGGSLLVPATYIAGSWKVI